RGGPGRAPGGGRRRGRRRPPPPHGRGGQGPGRPRRRRVGRRRRPPRPRGAPPRPLQVPVHRRGRGRAAHHAHGQGGAPHAPLTAGGQRPSVVDPQRVVGGVHALVEVGPVVGDRGEERPGAAGPRGDQARGDPLGACPQAPRLGRSL